MWLCFALFTGTLGSYLGYRMLRGDRRFLTPGSMTAGHHPIESQCDLCHTPMLGVKPDACMECHRAELERVDDSHPPGKFTDPRNADRLAKLDARHCATCHAEHRPELTVAMGVTQPVDHCHNCHENIAEERPSHAGLGFATCRDAGCHNFHDNRSLHEDYLERHLDEPMLVAGGHVPVETRALRALAKRTEPGLSREQHDAPASLQAAPALIAEWAETAHARAGVNCSGCHAPRSGAWTAEVELATCRGCHEGESEGFLGGKHGMRIAAGLSPMTPALARLPMREEAAHRELDCGTCHGAHRFDRARAAVEACVSCHDDEHSRGYLTSKHYELFQRELVGQAPAGSGVSCATCHLPRVSPLSGGVAAVAHNQNDFLRPNEKMLDAVCARCHGVPFAIDALADRALIARGVAGRPSRKVESVDMVRRKLAGLRQPGAAAR